MDKIGKLIREAKRANRIEELIKEAVGANPKCLGNNTLLVLEVWARQGATKRANGYWIPSSKLKYLYCPSSITRLRAKVFNSRRKK